MFLIPMYRKSQLDYIKDSSRPEAVTFAKQVLIDYRLLIGSNIWLMNRAIPSNIEQLSTVGVQLIIRVWSPDINVSRSRA